jgi:D,D-heptose 1,7-bisphosphate phosphatase
MNAAVFLDRDNTLIENDGDLGDPQKVALIRGAASAVASLKGLNYRVVVVTNQGGVARGKYSEADVDSVHKKINELIRTISGVQVDRFYYCPYHPEAAVEKYRGDHAWRKPRPGMLLQAAKDLDLDLSQSWTIGDQMRDVEAGASAGTRTILLSPDVEELPPLTSREIEARTGVPHFKARSLVEAVRIIAQQRKPETVQQLREGPPRPRAEGTLKAEASAVIHAASGPAKAPPRQPLAFRPWTAPPEPTRTASPARPASPPQPAAPADTTPPAPDPRPRPQPPAEATEPAGAADADAPDQPPPIQVSNQTLLRQILQELRNQRGRNADFAFLKMFAIVLQMVAIVCLLAGFWLGQADTDQFIRWLGAAVMLQLTAITLLLYQR